MDGLSSFSGSGPDSSLHKKLMSNIQKQYGIKLPSIKRKSKKKQKNKLKRKSPLKSEIDIRGGRGILKKIIKDTSSTSSTPSTSSASSTSSTSSTSSAPSTPSTVSKKYKDTLKSTLERSKKAKDTLFSNAKYAKDTLKKSREKRAKILREILGKKSKKSISQSGSGKVRSQYYGKRSKIMVKVPQNVKNTALYSFKLKKLGFGGGLETGWKRAKQLSTKKSIPIEDLRFMHAWFSRHLYASYPSYKKWKIAGRPKDSSWHRKHGIVSWLIWGGSPALNWVNGKVGLLNKSYPNKHFNKIKLK